MLPSKSCVLRCSRMQFQPLETGNSFANITGGQGKKSKEGGLMVSLKGGNNFFMSGWGDPLASFFPPELLLFKAKLLIMYQWGSKH